jgi:hypothetical protein
MSFLKVALQGALSVVMVFVAISSIANPVDDAKKAVQAGAASGSHSAASAGHSLAATGKLASGVAAVPLLLGGSVAVGLGTAASQVGKALMDASASNAQPLPITDEAITILPPHQALQKPTAPNN